MKAGSFCERLSAALVEKSNDKNNDNGYFRAAVMVPLVNVADELSILFEVRSGKMVWQPGEICFPGGRIEAADGDAIEAAIRETSEELGVPTSQVHVLGPLAHMVSPIGVLLYPCVGYLDDGPLQPNQDEVAELFTVPLKFLLAVEPRVGHVEMSTKPLADFPFKLLPDYPRSWKRRTTYQVYFYQYKDYVIWGLTAEVLKKFLDICRTVPR